MQLSPPCGLACVSAKPNDKEDDELELCPKQPQTKTATLKMQNGQKQKRPQPKRPHDMVIRSANMGTNNFPLTKLELLGQALKPRQK